MDDKRVRPAHQILFKLRKTIDYNVKRSNQEYFTQIRDVD